MILDPARWPARWQGVALVALFASYIVAAVAGPRGGTVASASFVVAPTVFGALCWRYSAMPWRHIASWTIPLLVWMAGLALIRPAPLPAFVGLALAGGWLGLIACWTPFVRWWYRFALHVDYRGPARAD